MVVGAGPNDAQGEFERRFLEFGPVLGPHEESSPVKVHRAVIKDTQTLDRHLPGNQRLPFVRQEARGRHAEGDGEPPPQGVLSSCRREVRQVERTVFATGEGDVFIRPFREDFGRFPAPADAARGRRLGMGKGFLQNGQDAVSHAVAVIAVVGVALVLHPREVRLGDKARNVLSGKRKEGTSEKQIGRAPALQRGERRYGGEPVDARAAHPLQKEGLEQIVPMVRRKEYLRPAAPHRLDQGFVTRPASGRLNPLSFCVDRDVQYLHGNVETLTEMKSKVAPLGRMGTQPVMHMQTQDADLAFGMRAHPACERRE